MTNTDRSEYIERKHAAISAAHALSSRSLAATGLMHSVPVGDGQMVLLTLERWTTAFAITWFFAADEPGTEIDFRLQAGLEWTATDDAGNAYEGFDIGGGGGNSPHWRATSWFVPPLDDRASHLTITLTNPVDGQPTTSEIDVDRSIGRDDADA